ncbi:MAG TPA: hypothetical protein PLG73_02430 [Candidatus Sumerlaeota bacterium]|nr:hypothetical protein [Candidatus Sumerlaeota bacterium]
MAQVPRQRKRPAGGIGIPAGIDPGIAQALGQIQDVLSRHEDQIGARTAPTVAKPFQVEVAAPKIEVRPSGEIVLYGRRLIFRDGRLVTATAPFPADTAPLPGAGVDAGGSVSGLAGVFRGTVMAWHMSSIVYGRDPAETVRAMALICNGGQTITDGVSFVFREVDVDGSEVATNQYQTGDRIYLGSNLELWTNFTGTGGGNPDGYEPSGPGRVQMGIRIALTDTPVYAYWPFPDGEAVDFTHAPVVSVTTDPGAMLQPVLVWTT